MVYKCQYCDKSFAKNKSLFLAHKKTCVKVYSHYYQPPTPPATQPQIPLVEHPFFEELMKPISRNMRDMEERGTPRCDYDPNAERLDYTEEEAQLPRLATNGIYYGRKGDSVSFASYVPQLHTNGRYPLTDFVEKRRYELIYPDDVVKIPNQGKYKTQIANYITLNREGCEDGEITAQLQELDDEQLKRNGCPCCSPPQSYLKRKTIAEWSFFRHKYLSFYYEGKGRKNHYWKAAQQVLFEQNLFSNFNWWILCHQYLRNVDCRNGATFFTQTPQQTTDRRYGVHNPQVPRTIDLADYNQMTPRVKLRKMRKHHQIMEDIHRKKAEKHMRFPPSIYDSRRYEDSTPIEVQSEQEEEEQ